MTARLFSFGAIVSACAIACNALTGIETLVAVDDERELSGSSGDPRSRELDAAPPNASSSSSSGSAGDASLADAATEDAAPTGTIFGGTAFPTAEACTGASSTLNASKSYDPDGRTAPGACRVCATDAGPMFIEFAGTAPKAGRATHEAYVRRVTGAASPVSGNIVLNVGGATITSSKNLGDNWVRLGGGSISVQSGTSVNVRVGLNNAQAGDRLVVDDVSIALP